MPEQDPLAQLRDIHLPNAISAWPPAPGWWILALIILTLLSGAIVFFYKRYQKNRYRRLALAALDQLNQNDNYPIFLQNLNALLKQTALAAKPTNNIASLSGKQWLEFLDKSSNTHDFSEGVGAVLLDGPYKPTPPTKNINQLQELSKRWIKRHRLPC
ncbi:MAG: DUF4381 domain-containing protein [Spongiibacteraceae bacterium]|nr:DUF4381 domain-containing protein [Spongiibacteraceae bacterium]